MAAERSSPHEVRWQQRQNGSNYETGDERGAQQLLYCFLSISLWEVHAITSLAFSQRTWPDHWPSKSSGCDKNAVSFSFPVPHGMAA